MKKECIESGNGNCEVCCVCKKTFELDDLHREFNGIKYDFYCDDCADKNLYDPMSAFGERMGDLSYL